MTNEQSRSQASERSSAEAVLGGAMLPIYQCSILAPKMLCSFHFIFSSICCKKVFAFSCSSAGLSPQQVHILISHEICEPLLCSFVPFQLKSEFIHCIVNSSTLSSIR